MDRRFTGMVGSAGIWRNWGRTYTCSPEALDRPTGEEEIASIVAAAGDRGSRVKAIGSGHSFTDIACTDGTMITLEDYNRVLDVDADKKTVTVQSGITLAALSEELARVGLALENMGDIGYQTVAGAISTATHGTGVQLGNLSTQVRALRLVTSTGEVVELTEETDPEMFRCACVGIGSLGVVSTVTIQCVDAFNLEALEEPRALDECLENLDEWVEKNEHFEFFWFPHTEVCLTKRNNRTDAPARRRGATATWVEDLLLENHTFGVLCRLGRARPSWIPSFNRFLTKTFSRSKKIDRSDHIFTTPRLVRFSEMEYAIPRQAADATLRALRKMVNDGDLHINFPVEVRFVAGDQLPLSPSFGRQTCYIAVHTFEQMDYQPYFRSVEAIMDEHQGRPHWGKLHFQTHATLSERYPMWEDFQRARKRLDPDGLFSNDYLERVLGPR